MTFAAGVVVLGFMIVKGSVTQKRKMVEAAGVEPASADLPDYRLRACRPSGRWSFPLRASITVSSTAQPARRC